MRCGIKEILNMHHGRGAKLRQSIMVTEGRGA